MTKYAMRQITLRAPPENASAKSGLSRKFCSPTSRVGSHQPVSSPASTTSAMRNGCVAARPARSPACSAACAAALPPSSTQARQRALAARQTKRAVAICAERAAVLAAVPALGEGERLGIVDGDGAGRAAQVRVTTVLPCRGGLCDTAFVPLATLAPLAEYRHSNF